MSIFSTSIRCMVALTMLCIGAQAAAGDDGAPRIEPEQLKERIEEPDLHILDVRIVSDWRNSGRKIRGAVRADPHGASSWARTLPKNAVVVVYCS